MPSSKQAIKSSLSPKLEHFLSQEESCLHQGFKLKVRHLDEDFQLMRVKSEIVKQRTIKKVRALTIQRSTIFSTSPTARMVAAAQIDNLLLIFKKSQMVVKAEW